MADCANRPTDPATTQATSTTHQRTMSSPTRTTSTNKRKVDALGNSGDSGRPAVIARLKDATSVSDPSFPTIPHIPPPVWGRVLDFMPYEEVRSALLVGKIIANEAVKYVRTLNFMKGYQLDVPSARRFAGVEEVNCLCLISGRESANIELCRDTTIRLVPLLTVFSKVRRTFVGGLIAEHQNGQTRLVRRLYRPMLCSSPANHMDLATALCQSLLGAFKARSLPSALDSRGDIADLFSHSDICLGNNGSADMCASCKDACSCLPLQEIIEHHYRCYGVNRIDTLEAIARRKGAKEIFRAESGDYLTYLLDGRFDTFPIEGAKLEEDEALRRKIHYLGVESEDPDVNVWFLKASDLTELDRWIAVGFDPRAVSKEDLYEMMHIGTDDRSGDVYAKSTFDALVARGFAFDEADLIVLDERMEPALKDLSALIRGDS